MDAAQPISSPQNPRIKQLVRLNNRRQRDQAQRTLVEGVREVGRALARGIVPLEAYVCSDLAQGAEAMAVIDTLTHLAATGQTQLFTIPPSLFQKIAYRGQSGGMVLVVPYQTRSFNDLVLGVLPFLTVIDGAEKPGNIGAILRTADGAGVDALLLAGDEQARTDLHNPNVIRASLGAAFTVPSVAAPTAAIIAWLRARQIAIVATTPEASALYTAVSFKGPVAIVMGSEAFGLGVDWLAAADEQVRIPMAGTVDSLNLSVATALLLYEVVRQRG